MKNFKGAVFSIANRTIVFMLSIVLILGSFTASAWAEIADTAPSASEEQSQEPPSSDQNEQGGYALLGEPAPFGEELLLEENEADAEAPEFSPQPTTLEEVQAVIDEYEALYAEALTQGGFLAALEVKKPHWEHEVSSEMMPSGYACELVPAGSDISDFEADYYTFFISDIMPLSGGSGTENDPFVISTAGELEDLAKSVNDGNDKAGLYYVLGADIDLSSKPNWLRIGTTTLSRAFAGTFDGNKFKITGFSSVGNTGGCNGLFGYVNEGTVTNLDITLGGAISGTTDNVGVVVGYAESAKVTDCKVNGNGKSISGTLNLGAIVGYANNSTITGCEVTGNGLTLSPGTGRSGGIVGYAHSSVTVDSCKVTGITATRGYENAGIAGRLSSFGSSSSGNNTVTNCAVSDSTFTVTGGGYAAGLIGIVEDRNVTRSSISNCTVKNVTTSTNANYSAGLIGAARFADVRDCKVADSNITAGLEYAGGFFGVVYDGTRVSGCSAVDVTVSAVNFAGGFSGATYSGTATSNIANSSVAGGSVACSGSRVGGFTGRLYDSASITNSYAQIDVFNKNTASTAYGTGGFIGIMNSSGSVTNCYATGSVNSGRDNNAGSFVGSLISPTTAVVQNCYATGTVIGTGANRGGFAGYASNENTFSNCFYDKTTTRMTKDTGNVADASGITGYETKKMILLKSYTNWNAQNNLFGAANGSGNDSSPWYIDDNFTYPYFYYQYDGQSKEDTNYFLAGTLYADNTALGQKRADFKVTKDSFPLQVKSVGAVKAYLPYSGTSRYDINKTSFTSVPGVTYSDSSNSLGSISKTNIISFGGAPYAEKTSDRPKWDYTKPDTFTYVGDTVTYTIVVWNYSDDADFEEVQVDDSLLATLDLIPGSVTVSAGAKYDPDNHIVLTDDSAGGKPYYTYDGASGNFSIFLKDMPKIDGASGNIASYTITYQVFVGKDAASVFTDPAAKPPLFERDIKNDAELKGNLRYTGATETEKFSFQFSDENKDPVYDACVFEFTKLRLGSSTPLEGVEFSLYFWTGTGAPPENSLVSAETITTDLSAPDKWYLIKATQSNSEGLVHFRLGTPPTTYPGYFQLVEDQASSGFLTPDGQWLLHVNGIAYVETIKTIQSAKPDAIVAPNFTVTTKTVTRDPDVYTVIDTAALENGKLGSITLKKTNAEGTPLEGAEFAIQQLISGEWRYLSYDPTTGVWTPQDSMNYTKKTQFFTSEKTSAGTIFEKLPEGQYKIIETKSPDGYSTLLKPIEATIPFKDPEGVLHYDLTFTVADREAVQLPTSGTFITPELLVLIGLLAIALVMGVIGTRWSKRRSQGQKEIKIEPD